MPLIALKQAAMKDLGGLRVYDTGLSIYGMPVATLDPSEARAYDDGAVPPPGFSVGPVLYRVPDSLRGL